MGKKVHINKVVSGVCCYIDNFLANEYADNELLKVIYGAGAAIYIKNNVPKYAKAIEALGIYNPDTEMVDIDSIKDEIASRIGTDGITITKKPIGKLTFMKEDIDELYDIIMSI